MIEGLDKLNNGVVVGIYEGFEFSALYIKTDSGAYALDIEAGKVRVMEIEDAKSSDERTALLQKLKEKTDLRDQMGGALYWNILNDECCQIANQCSAAECDRQEIRNILGQGNFYG